MKNQPDIHDPGRGERGFSARTPTHLLLIVLLSMAVYSNSLQGAFQFDDQANIVENAAIRSFEVFRDPLKIKDLDVPLNVKALFGTRYAGFLSLALNYRIHGYNVSGYHAVNISIHIVNALLVYWLVLFTLSTPLKVRPEEAGDTYPEARSAAFFSALLFAVHPLQTQAVTYIVQRFTSLATGFFLLSLVLYIGSRRSGRRAGCYGLYAASLASAVCAMLTKEISVTLPLIILLYEFMFLEGEKKKRLLFLVPMLLTLCVIPLVMIFVNGPVSHLDSSTVFKIASSRSMSRWDYLFTQFSVIVTYIRLLVFPVGQNIDYDYPLFHSFFNSRVMLSFFFLVLTAGLGLRLLLVSRAKGPRAGRIYRLAAFGIFWFFITLSVESSVIPIADVIFEHRTYLPSIGFISAFVALIEIKKESVRGYFPLPVLAALCVCILAVSAYMRNGVWRDGETLWRDAERKSPGKSRPHYNLGVYYDGLGRNEDALREFEKALAIRANPDTLNNLGVLYGKTGHYDKAVAALKRAVLLAPLDADPHKNLGVVYSSRGLYEEALAEYRLALARSPDNADLRISMGSAYEGLSRFDEAIAEYRVALKRNPMIADSINNSGIALFKKGDFDGALNKYRVAAALSPGMAQVHYNMGMALMKEKRYKEAEQAFRETLRLKPDLERAYYRLGMLCLIMGRDKDAFREFRKAVMYKPDYEEALGQLDALRKKGFGNTGQEE